MYGRARKIVLLVPLAFLLGIPAFAQVMHPTPAPLVTAENEGWFLNGEPISYAGGLYYPSGTQVFFNPNEMVRSGFHLGIPLYSRTTEEPFRVVYVPLAGGVMQPYVRARVSDTAGAPLQAAAPPTLTAPTVPQGMPQPVGTAGAAEVVAPPQPVGTSGRVPAPPRTVHTRIGGRPQGINGVFIQFEGQRWLSTGRTLELDAARMEKIGEYSGFEVWAYRADRDRIYLPVTRGGSLLVPYSRDDRKK